MLVTSWEQCDVDFVFLNFISHILIFSHVVVVVADVVVPVTVVVDIARFWFIVNTVSLSFTSLTVTSFVTWTDQLWCGASMSKFCRALPSTVIVDVNDHRHELSSSALFGTNIFICTASSSRSRTPRTRLLRHMYSNWLQWVQLYTAKKPVAVEFVLVFYVCSFLAKPQLGQITVIVFVTVESFVEISNL